jgi:OOP family OmpA-OmpF porin
MDRFGMALIAGIAVLSTARLEGSGLGHQTFDARATAEALESYRLVKLHRIYFALGKADLSIEDEASLGQVVRRFCRTNQVVIELRGYADGTGSVERDLTLSTKRAEAIARSLAANGIPSQRIHVAGLGEVDETGPRDNPEHQRVDIRIFVNPETPSNAK